jgi:REP element-mobilizing transposase RayT
MPRKWRIRFVGARYHVTSRGNGRETIFYSDQDRERFLEQLDAALAADGVMLYAYCLMPNHYHLLVETPLGNIQRFMHRLNTAYSMYFRYKVSVRVAPGK